jgi:hypothetical protein
MASGTAEAQILKKLGNAAKNAAERALERQTEKRTEDAVNKTVDDVFDGKKEDEQQQGNAPANADAQGNPQAPAAQAPQQSLEMTYAKSDFVPGDEIMFEDNLVGEQLGEFPSMWDLKEGNAEVANVGGENAIHFGQATLIMPFMKEKDYLPDVYRGRLPSRR